jgi:hypothetical protein
MRPFPFAGLVTELLHSGRSPCQPCLRQMRPNADSNCTSRLRSVAGVILAGLVGCTGSTRSDVTATVALVLPNGWNVTSASYVVWSSDRLPVLEGTESLSDAEAALSLSVLVPAGSAYVMDLTVMTSNGESCSGTSQPFNVLPGLPTGVSLVLSCLPAQPPADICPTVAVQPPSPAEANAPLGRLSIGATASDADPGDALTFTWAASAGTFGDPAAQSTYYVCTTAGAQTLVLIVDDHHVPDSCTETFLLPVTCLAEPGDAGTCANGCGPPSGS